MHRAFQRWELKKVREGLGGHCNLLTTLHRISALKHYYTIFCNNFCDNGL